MVNLAGLTRASTWHYMGTGATSTFLTKSHLRNGVGD